MKKLVYLCVMMIALSSCSEYQQVLKNEEIGPKYTLANELFEEGRFSKALRLYEQVIPEYRGKAQAEVLQYRYAMTFYMLEDYLLSAYQMERFSKSYPQSEKAEEMEFLAAKSLYLESPRYSLDQSDTKKSISQMQAFINKYPDSQYGDEANMLIGEMQAKLEKKAYEICWRYYHTQRYPNAITALENFMLDYPGTPYKDDAAYLLADSQFQYAIKSYDDLVQERLVDAKNRFKSFQRKYPDSEFFAESEEKMIEINNRLEAFTGS